MQKRRSKIKINESQHNKQLIDSCTNDPKDAPCYNNNQTTNVQRVYLLGLIGWIILIILYKLVPTSDFIEIIILFIPIFVFSVSYMSVPNITYRIEKYMFKANLLTIGLLVALPLINWGYTGSDKNRTIFIKLAATAIIFSMITLIDIWVPAKFLPIIKHVKSVFQTSAIVLLIFGLYRFFIEQTNNNNTAIINVNKN